MSRDLSVDKNQCQVRDEMNNDEHCIELAASLKPDNCSVIVMVLCVVSLSVTDSDSGFDNSQEYEIVCSNTFLSITTMC